MAVFRVNKNSNVFIIALRGTQFSDVNDLTADMAIIRGIIADAATARNVRNSSRYRADVANITEVEGVVKSYLRLPNPIYYAVGHSLSGSIIDEMLRDGLISSAVSFNPAVERVNLDEPNNNHRVYLECDVLYNLIGKFITNGNLEVISKANPAGADAGPIDTTKGSLECHNIKTVIPLMSGKGINNNIVLSYKQPLMFQDVDVGAYRNANEKFRPLGRGIFEHIVSNIGKNLAGEAEKGDIFGRIKRTVEEGKRRRKEEDEREWQNSALGKIGIPNPTKLAAGLFGGGLTHAVDDPNWSRNAMMRNLGFSGYGIGGGLTHAVDDPNWSRNAMMRNLGFSGYGIGGADDSVELFKKMAERACVAKCSRGGALPKGYHQMPDGRIMKDSDTRQPMADDAFFQGRGLTDVLRYGRGKKFNQKQLTKIILDKNKVIADLEENAYSGKGLRRNY
jgi:hypothetical protein